MTNAKEKDFLPKTIITSPFTLNGRNYETFEIRYPTWSEVENNYNAISDAGSIEGTKAMKAITKLCIINLTHKSDFDAFPSSVALELMNTVGKLIA